MISLVMPTYNEEPVVEDTLRRACSVLRNSVDNFEIIVVDDASPDGTAEIVEALSRELPVRVLRRQGRRGLASAVVDGWAIARGDLLGVMDADLQHPPEVLAALARALESPSVDVAIASRYAAGGGTSRWSWLRHFISRSGMRLGACVLPWTLGEITDSGSGMFLVRSSALKGAKLDPIGFKTLLEVLGKAHYRGVVEVPYVFNGRVRGQSKLGARQYLEYLLHLARLARSTGELRTWVRFGAVGLTGAIISIGALYLLVERARWRLALALPAAIELALVSNFFCNHKVTFYARRAAPHSQSRVLSRFLRYQTACAPGAILGALVTLVLASLGVQLIRAAAAGVVAGGLWNMLFNIPNIWRVWDPPPPRATSGRLSGPGAPEILC